MLSCMLWCLVRSSELMFVSLQIILMTLENSKISVLLGVLDFNPDDSQKTLIVANSAQEVEDVFKVCILLNNSAL